MLGFAPSAVSSFVVGSDSANRALTYSIAQAPVHGTVAIDAKTGSFTYSLSGHAVTDSDQFTVNVTNGAQTAAGVVRVKLSRDPLLEAQWHIRNTGSSAFSSILPTPGNDMNVAPAWAAGYTGKGVKVAVVDSGLEAAHEDLAANVDVSKSFNFLTGGNDPTPAPSTSGTDHGTQVAGIIGAIGFNGKGGRGVAYRSTLRGYNAIASSASVANYAKSFGVDPISSDNDIFNASFRLSADAALPTFMATYAAIAQNLETLRGGKGAIHVNSGGNTFGSVGVPGACEVAGIYGVSCGHTASDERRGGIVPIVVGALNANGIKASYSTSGSSLWIAAPGGEFGLSEAYAPNRPINSYRPAIVTTSRTGCAYAEESTPVNPLDAKGANALAANCQYTALMNGTSSAAPNVSAGVALMLEANPNLGWRDVKYILARTARRVDPSFAGKFATDVIPSTNHQLEQGWVTNKAGWTFSNWYGFGAIDIGAAVALAKTYTSYLPPLTQTGAAKYAIIPSGLLRVPPLSSQGFAVSFQVTESFTTVEHATVFVSIAQTYLGTCNQIELTSPSGTKSILLHGGSGMQNTSMMQVRLMSNAFYGESPNGTWTLRFLDLCGSSPSTFLSSTQPQVLGLSGH